MEPADIDQIDIAIIVGVQCLARWGKAHVFRAGQAIGNGGEVGPVYIAVEVMITGVAQEREFPRQLLFAQSYTECAA